MATALKRENERLEREKSALSAEVLQTRERLAVAKKECTDLLQAKQELEKRLTEATASVTRAGEADRKSERSLWRLLAAGGLVITMVYILGVVVGSRALADSRQQEQVVAAGGEPS